MASKVRGQSKRFALLLLVIILALFLIRPLLPSPVALWGMGRATVYNTLPCHFATSSKERYLPMVTRTEAWRSCAIDVSAFDSFSGLRRPASTMLKPNRARLIAKLLNGKLRLWLERRSEAQNRPPAQGHEVTSCPEEGQRANTEAEVASYQERYSAGAGCLTLNSVWGNEILCEQFCKVAAIGTLLTYSESELVFDWGAGCGHALGWLERCFGSRTTGHELHGELLQSAAKYTSATQLCHGNGATLQHLPDSHLDHIISNAALYHLSPPEQCKLIVQDFLRILRPGGTIWVGWNGSEEDGDMHGQQRMTMHDWRLCLEKSPVPILFDGLVEEHFFGVSEHNRKQTYSLIIVKLDPDADPL